MIFKKNAFLFISLFSLILSACSSPPEATPYPKNSKEINLNNFIFSSSSKGTAKNTLDKENWRVIYSQQGLVINQDSWSKFWYLAQNSNVIKISGDKKNVNAMILKLIKNGVSAKIISDINCVNCNIVTLSFLKTEV